DVLSSGFMLLTLLAYTAYVRRPQATRYAAVVGLFACALMSKPMAVTWPIVLLLCDVWPLQRLTLVAPDGARWRRAIVEKLPLLMLSLAASAITILLQERVGAMAGINVLDGPARVSNAIVGYVGYLGSALWPTHLAAFYPLHPWPIAITAAALALLVVLTVSAWRVRARYPFVLVGWLWFLVMLVPVSGVLQAGEQARADRFMYLPMVGLVMVVTWGAVALAERLAWPTRPLAAIGAAIVVALAIVAHAQVPVWANSLSLWQHATHVAPSYLAFEKLGQSQRDSAQWAAARASYQTAATMAPREWTGYHAILRNAMGMVELEAGDVPEAARLFGEARTLNPSLVEARINLGNALAATGQAAAAEMEFREAARLDPSLAEPRIGLAAAVFDQGRTTEAVTLFADAARAFPDVAEAHTGLGSALAKSGRLDDAIAEYRLALQRNPALASAHLNLGITLAQRGDLSGAMQELEAALRIDPGLEPARRALAAIRR
ncbi:MAG: tetratricopeptide repeat protein, partial [Acidobacteria bacterium]|nr:tetratricopeptide repeat protein [Acidobacteriota bacterium]